MFEIENDVPIPPNARGRNNKYPWADMKVGDSFFVPGPPSGANPVTSSAYNQNIKNIKNGIKGRWSCQGKDGGTRVWRVE